MTKTETFVMLGTLYSKSKRIVKGSDSKRFTVQKFVDTIFPPRFDFICTQKKPSRLSILLKGLPDNHPYLVERDQLNQVYGENNAICTLTETLDCFFEENTR